MFDIGFSELLLFGVIALIVLGPEKLPHAARTAGRWYAKLRRTVSTLQSEIEAELDLAETRQLMQKELAKIRQTEAQMRQEMAEMRGSIKEFESTQNQSVYATDTQKESAEQPSITPDYRYDSEATQQDADLSSRIEPTTKKHTLVVQPMITRPWENMWFRLSPYDKTRRLPAPPYLPNYRADVLLNKQAIATQQGEWLMSLFKHKKSRQEKVASSEELTDHNALADTPSSSLVDMPITEHLIELRAHLIKICAAVLIIFLALVGFSRELYDFLSDPLVAQLPANSTMIATDITSNFMAPIRLTIFVAAFVAMPYILYQIWSFVAPGLYKKEKKIAIPVLFSSIFLFYAGVAFAYFIVLKGVLKFFIMFAPQNVLPMTDIDSYLSFALKLFMVFGVTFEIPVVTLLLILAGIVSIDSLEDKRRYIIVGCFAVAAVVTPPDGVSMLMLAFPMWLLFELGLFLAKILIKDEPKKEHSADSVGAVNLDK